MHLKFECSNCHQVLVTKYLDVGDPAKCRFCGATVVIPDNAERTEAHATVDASLADTYRGHGTESEGTSGVPATSTPELGSSADILDQLERADWLRLAWGFWWRALCISALVMISGGILGGVIGALAGLVFALLHVPQEQWMLPLQIATGTLGLGLGFLSLILYVKWLLSARFGSLRLTLIRTGQSEKSPTPSHLV